MLSSGYPANSAKMQQRAVDGNTPGRGKMMYTKVREGRGKAEGVLGSSNIKTSRNTWSTIAHPFLPDQLKYLVIYSLPSGSVYINRIN